VLESATEPSGMNFETLPSLIALAILVVVFRAILRQGTSEPLHLWLTGWILVLVHFVAQFVDTGNGLWDRIASSVSIGALELASIAFLISVSLVATDRRRQLLLAAVIGIPALVYTVANIWDVTSHIFYYVVIAVAFVGALLVVWNFYRKTTLYVISLSTGCAVLAYGMVWAVTRNKANLGVVFLLAALNYIVATLFWRRFSRPTIGVLTTVFGFVAWGSVFPIGTLQDIFAPSMHIESEVWNIPKYFVAVGMIVILLEDQIQKSDYLAYHDELTGLPNRRLLEDRLDQALARANRKGNKVAVLLLDLDHFKQVNDNFGHRIGDLTLQQVVTRLASRMRVSDTLARSGGDEFTVISDVADAEGAQVLVSNLEMAFTVPFKMEGKLIHTGLSIGLALYPDDGRTPDELYAAADQAMYVSKRASRGPGAFNALSQFRM
jgi:diguanylate cyclase (GGDEF)-like protein